MSAIWFPVSGGVLDQGDLKVEESRRLWLIWPISLVVWVFMALTNGLSIYQWRRSLGYPASLPNELVLPLVNFLIFAALSPVVFRLALRYPIDRLHSKKRISFYLIGSVVFSIVHVAIRVLAYPVANPRGGTSPICLKLFATLFYYNIADDVFSAYLPVVLVANVISYYQKFRNRERRTLQLEAQLAKAQLDVLKSQLQPHFLFNTLHSISSLMLTNVQAADKMMSRLSDLLRMTLDNQRVQETTLDCEMEFIDGYLQIEKMRFEDRLNIKMDIAADTRDASVPYLLLQPLVENAIRHGVSKRSSGGEIRIASRHDDRYLYLTIGDNGPGFHETEDWARGGLGLRATRERLHTLYGSDQSVELESVSGRGTNACVRIPFRVEPRLLLHEMAAARSDE